MASVREIQSRAELVELIRADLAPFQVHVEPGQIHVEPYIRDERIGWDTHLITIDGYGVWGMSDGPL